MNIKQLVNAFLEWAHLKRTSQAPSSHEENPENAIIQLPDSDIRSIRQDPGSIGHGATEAIPSPTQERLASLARALPAVPKEAQAIRHSTETPADEVIRLINEKKHMQAQIKANELFDQVSRIDPDKRDTAKEFVECVYKLTNDPVQLTPGKVQTHKYLGPIQVGPSLFIARTNDTPFKEDLISKSRDKSMAQFLLMADPRYMLFDTKLYDGSSKGAKMLDSDEFLYVGPDYVACDHLNEFSPSPHVRQRVLEGDNARFDTESVGTGHFAIISDTEKRIFHLYKPEQLPEGGIISGAGKLQKQVPFSSVDKVRITREIKKQAPNLF